MGKFIDMTGWVMSEHGVPDSRLTVIERSGSSCDGSVRWVCKCSCGNTKNLIVSGTDARSGKVLSCGCVHKERASIAKKKYNLYDISGEYGIGWTSNTNKEFYFDLEDYDKIKDLCWVESVDNGVHRLIAYNPKTKKRIRMHVLLGYKNFDHIDKNELNNLHNNFRECTHQQNDFNRGLYSNNTSGVTGVCWHKQCQKWKAAIMIDGKTIHLGVFDDKNEAIRKRLMAEIKYFGEFAPQKHLFKQYGIIPQNDCEETV